MEVFPSHSFFLCVYPMAPAAPSRNISYRKAKLSSAAAELGYFCQYFSKNLIQSNLQIFFLPEHYRLLWSSPTDHITCISGVQDSIFPWQHLWILIPKQRLNSSTPRRIDNRISPTCNVQFSLLFRNSTNLSTTPWVFITSSIGGFGSETARQCQRVNRPHAGE